MSSMSIVKVATVQAEPCWFDLTASVDKAVGFMQEAATQGAQLIAFGECWIGGYPFYIWHDSPGFALQMHPLFLEYAGLTGDVDSPLWMRLRQAASENKIAAVVGFNLRENRTLWIAQALITAEGEVAWIRRKLKPTHQERTVFADGDGSDFHVTDVPEIGRVGALSCWEHVQPLSKFVQYSANEEFHVASWPAFNLLRGANHMMSTETNMAVTQVYALEGGCFVLSATSCVTEVYKNKLIELVGMLPDGQLKFPDQPPDADGNYFIIPPKMPFNAEAYDMMFNAIGGGAARIYSPDSQVMAQACLLYTSDAADEEDSVDLGGRGIIKKKKAERNRRAGRYRTTR
eukprot:TRINITY_DN27895_c0_g1_i2.p1 TRINITY_DN27895_c0_g1~~TRINITY_DN27895_c0_g1_i2.p1  ORF type:complete len:345 (+),score=83.92 TRINITY_DN27895_c0_g1_i2:200-1234(+)